MMFKETIAKEELQEMPKVLFGGRIYVASTPQEAERAVRYLKKTYRVLGIDSETRPSFVKGQLHKVALLQVASADECFLFRLNLTGLTLPIISLLESPHITKVGLSLRDDFMMLHRRAPFTPQACVELQNLVEAFGIQEKSLQKIYAILFEKKISKGQRLTNWEAETLTEPQKRYAATDAWACVHIYNCLLELKE
jgi:ribonuclease D